jgi:hypothetical protein
MEAIMLKKLLMIIAVLLLLGAIAHAEVKSSGPNPSCLQWNQAAGWSFFDYLPYLEGYVVGRNDAEHADVLERYGTEFSDLLKKYCKEHPEERFLHGARMAYDAVLRMKHKAALAGQTTILGSLSVDLQKKIEETRASCIEQGASPRTIWDDTGLTRFTLSNGIDAVLVNDGELCGGETIKGANCHTGGCDVTIYARIRGTWRQVLEGRNSVFVSVDWRSKDSMLLGLVVSLRGDDQGCPIREANVRAHGTTAWKHGQCDVIARWDGSKFVYRMLQ